jgi:glycosyltransferase involved in cell wall biosynthesis
MRRKVLLVQPSMQPPGGGNGVAAWMLQALVDEHDVTVLSWRPVDVEPINRFFGTSLDPRRFSTLLTPAWWRHATDRLPVPVALVRGGLLMRHTRRVAPRFDVIIGAHNEMDYGRRGIQYIHYPTYWRPRPAVDLRWYHRFPPMLHGYYFIADRLAGFSMDRMKGNLTLTNSNWTASHVRRFLGIDAHTVYPPVVGASASVDWSERRAAFVAMGRVSPEKEYERVIRIVARVRMQAAHTSLTIVGTWDANTERYYQSLVTLGRALDPAGEWLTFRRDLSRDAVRALLTTTRYGIHGMREEHFGMAPAEMVRAGMIVWVPDGGGQVEIVGDAPELRYNTDDEAVDSIVRVMGDAAIARRLREQLRVHGEQFSEVHFMTRVQNIVRDFVA